MEISFTPSDDVIVILNALLDKFENRSKRGYTLKEAEGKNQSSLDTQLSPEPGRRAASRHIKVSLVDLPLPAYFSQTDPEPRTIANRQLQTLEKCGHLNLAWLPGESGHLLQTITLKTELHPERSRRDAPRSTQHDVLYKLIQRTPIRDHRARLESLLLAEKFRYQKDDWRARALDHTLQQLRTGKSPSPFSLADSNLNIDLLAILQALPTLTIETPYRIFSVRVFNDSKHFEDLKLALVRLARRANPEWKSFTSEALLRELNLVSNPGYIHLAGNWELTDINGQLINLDSFTPSVGFPASQITSLQKITLRAESILCIENLTSFHEFLRANAAGFAQHATICLMGNPSPPIRYLLRRIPEEIPIYLWSDMDYGGFKILSQLRKQVCSRIHPYRMDIATFDAYAHFARPLTASDARNLKHLMLTPNLKDIRPTIDHLLKRGLKLEQEALQT